MSLPHPPASPAPAPSPSVDGSALLLEAVRHRDETATARLLRRWVHRHGLESIHRFCRTTLTTLEGPSASAWLEERIAAPAAVTAMPMAEAPPPMPVAAPSITEPAAAPAMTEPAAAAPAAAVPGPAAAVDPPLESEPSPVENEPAPAAAAVPPARSEAESDAGAPAPAPSLGASSVRLEVAAIDPWLSPSERPAVAAFGQPEAENPAGGPVESPLPTTTEPLPAMEREAAQDAEEPYGDAALDDEPEGAPMGGGLRSLGRLGRLSSMMWNSLETLGRGRSRGGEPTDTATEADADPGDTADTDPTAGDDAADLIASAATASPLTMETPVKDGKAGPSPSPAPRSVLPPEASLPPTPSSHRPAPPPSTLQDLRSWLPDAGDSKQFPRAS